MNAVLGGASLLVAVAALVSAAGALWATGRVTVALPVLLDLLLAAGLLRLALRPSPVALLGTALLVLVKRLASAGVRRAAASRG